MHTRGALQTLAHFALSHAETDDERLVIYRSIAHLGGADQFAQLAQRAAEQLCKSETARTEAMTAHQVLLESLKEAPQP